jgi:hypothetical protein
MVMGMKGLSYETRLEKLGGLMIHCIKTAWDIESQTELKLHRTASQLGLGLDFQRSTQSRCSPMQWIMRPKTWKIGDMEFGGKKG